MISLSLSRPLVFFAAVFSCVAAVSTCADATTVRLYQVDPDQSYIDAQITATYLGQPFELQPQAPGSLHTKLNGTIGLEFLTPNSFRTLLNAGANVTLSDLPGVFEPDGLSANLAGFADLSSIEPGAQVEFLARNIAFVLLGGAQLDSTGVFSTDLWGANLQEPSELRVRDPLTDITYLRTGILEALPGGEGSLTEVGGQSRFEMPLDTVPTRISFIFLDARMIYTFTMTGRVVAYAAVPEPSTWVLAATGIALLAVARGRRRR